ncbi:MAG: alpha/beta hydrolase fold domain-containing protein, partial [candidate division NC10 bacterium]
LNVSREASPAIIFYGTSDPLMEQGLRYIEQAKELGVEAQLYAAEGVEHGFFNKDPWRSATLRLADEFLAKHGYTKAPPTVAAVRPEPLPI